MFYSAGPKPTVVSYPVFSLGLPTSIYIIKIITHRYALGWTLYTQWYTQLYQWDSGSTWSTQCLIETLDQADLHDALLRPSSQRFYFVLPKQITKPRVNVNSESMSIGRQKSWLISFTQYTVLLENAHRSLWRRMRKRVPVKFLVLWENPSYKGHAFYS